MAAPRESIGSIPCLCCGESIPVKKSAGGAIAVCCSWCDITAYAKEGTEAFRNIMGKAKFSKPAVPPAAPAAAPDPAPVASPQPAPPPAAKPAPRKIPLFGG